MTAVTDIDRVIIVIDLRDTDLALLVTRRLSEVLAERAPGGDGSRVDFGRVIVVDDAAALASHHEVYAHILDSHVDFSLLCLAIGPGPGDDPTLAVRRPFPLGPPKAATLWIGDVHGIGWRMESTQADLVHVPGQDAETKMPSGLIEVLRVPQVFDHVIEVVGAMPGAVACPGLRVTRSDIDTDVLIDAQRAAIRQLTDPGRGPGDPAPPVDASRLFSPQGRQPARTSDVIRPGGKIDELYQRSRRAEREVVQVRGRITGLVGLLSAEAGSLRGIIARFADALNELTDVMSRALDWADPRTGFDTVHRGQLDQLGIELSLVRPTGPSHTVEVLGELALTAIDRHQPLPAIAERLRDEADRIVPQGTSSYLERLNRICPASEIRRLRTLPAVLPAVPPVGLLAATFVACLLIGLWPTPVAVCGAVAVLGVAADAIWIWSRARAIAPSPPSAGLLFFLSQLGVAVVGSACGTALSRVITLPVPAGPAGLVPGLVITVVLVLALASFSWSRLAGRWFASLHLSRLTGAADTLRALIAEAARDEWQVADERAAASDYARIIAGIVDDTAVGLRAYAAGLPDPGHHRGARESRRHDYDRVSGELVLLDLTDAVADTLGRLAATLGASSLVSVDGATVRRELAGTLTTYRVHLATTGLHEVPPFGRESEQRQALARSLMERGTDLQQLIRAGVEDERITQLCAPEDLMMLETEVTSAVLIRFAPRAAQEFVGTVLGRQPSVWAQGRPVDWIAASAVAGVLRLVPLRPSAVQEVWPAAETAPGSGAGRADGWRHSAMGQDGAAGD